MITQNEEKSNPLGFLDNGVNDQLVNGQSVRFLFLIDVYIYIFDFTIVPIKFALGWDDQWKCSFFPLTPSCDDLSFSLPSLVAKATSSDHSSWYHL